MSQEVLLLALGLGIFGVALFTLSGSYVSQQWRGWVVRASVAAVAGYVVGMLLLGLPGAIFLDMFVGPGSRLPPDSAWPLAILITQVGAMLIMPASLLLRVALPNAVGLGHAGATALLTAVATSVLSMLLVGAYEASPSETAPQLSW